MTQHQAIAIPGKVEAYPVSEHARMGPFLVTSVAT